MIKTEGIACFIAVASSGSISEAARRLSLSKSAMSERLADIERTLGTRLLHRTTRKVCLTEDGAAFLDRANRIMREIQEATNDLSERRGSLSGPLRISAPVTFGRMHLGPALYPFLRENPELELTLDLNDRRVDAIADGYDAVVRHGLIDDSRLIVWKLAPSQRVLVASPGYLDRHGRPRSLKDLQMHRGIYYTNRGATDWCFDLPEGVQSVRAFQALRVNNGDMMMDAAAAGLGIAMLPTFIVAAAVRASALAVIDVGAPSAREYVYVAHPGGQPPSAKLRAFVSSVKAAIGDPPYWGIPLPDAGESVE